jgi:hypothetical protein
MGSRVFKTVPPYTIVFDVLDEVCPTDEGGFVVTESGFRSLARKNLLSTMCDELEPYYHSSKKHYLARVLDYSGFLTILRQVCKVHCISYVSRIEYTHSSYSKKLIIYLARNNWRDGIVQAVPNAKRCGEVNLAGSVS